MSLHIVEGVSGLWHYHLAKSGTNATALCGARTMGTNIKIEEWALPFGEHFPKRPTWCHECEAKAHAPFAAVCESKEK